MIAESIIFVLGVVFAVALSRSPGMKWLPGVLVGLGGLFVLLSFAIFFIPAPKVVPAFASAAVLFSAVGARWRTVGAVGGVMGCVTAVAGAVWWLYSGGVVELQVSLSGRGSDLPGSMAFTANATRTFAVTTVLALEEVVIWVITRRKAEE